MRVKAHFPYGGFGFDGISRRRHGDEFSIDEALFDDSWMVRVGAKAPADADAGETVAPKKRGRKPATVEPAE